MDHLMVIKGTKEMRLSAILAVLTAFRYDTPFRRVKALFNSTTVTGDAHAIRDIENGLWVDLQREGERSGHRIDPPAFGMRSNLCCIVNATKNFRILVPYNPGNIKAVTFELSEYKDVLSIICQEGEELRIFGRVLYKLGGNPKVLEELVGINGEVLQLGYWLAAFICKMMNDPVGYMMYKDEGSEKV